MLCCPKELCDSLLWLFFKLLFVSIKEYIISPTITRECISNCFPGSVVGFALTHLYFLWPVAWFSKAPILGREEQRARRSTGEWKGASYVTCMHEYVAVNPTVTCNYNTLIITKIHTLGLIRCNRTRKEPLKCKENPHLNWWLGGQFIFTFILSLFLGVMSVAY